MIRAGEFLAENLDVPEEAVQPAGVDLSVGEVYALEGTAVLGDDGYEKTERERVERVERDDGNYYELERGSYVVVYDEVVRIPEDHVGLVFPRSRLMRCGLDLRTAVWDPGYEGKGEGGLRVDADEAYVEEGMRLCQLVLFETESIEGSYDGTHQGERL